MNYGQAHWMRLSGQTGQVRYEFPYSVNGNSGRVKTDDAGYSYLFDVVPFLRVDSMEIGNTYVPLPAGFNRNHEFGIVAKLDPAGAPQWVRFCPGPDTGQIYTGDVNLALAADGTPHVIIGGSYYSPNPVHSFGLPLPAPPSMPSYNEPDGFLAAFDAATGTPQWVAPVAVGRDQSGLGWLEVAGNGDMLISGSARGSYIRFGSVLLPFSGIPSADDKLYMVRAVARYNQITGAVYVDYDSTSTLSSGDRVFENCVVQTHPEDFFFATDTSGRYGTVITQMGANTVTLPAVPIYHTLPPPPPAPATFSTFGKVAPGRDFRLQPAPNQQDIQVFLTPLTENALEGSDMGYQVFYRNLGTTPITSGTLTLTFDGHLTYSSHTGAATLSGNTITLPYTNLLPGESHSFEAWFIVPTTAPGGTILLSTATITPLTGDLTPGDNTETVRQPIWPVNDPFGCRVSWPAITPAQVAAGEWLDYTIYFDNQGTDTVSSVMLRDSLPVAQLRMGSLDLLTASHACRWRLSPTGVLTATLTGARLTPRSRDARHSAGFARFRVRVAPSLQLGDVVANRANVHFDARPVATTPVGLTTVQIVTGLPTSPTDLAASVWPNPTAGTLHVTLPHATATEALTLTLLDALGRPVLTHTTATTADISLDVRALPAGLYVLRGQQGGRAFSRRVVVR